MKLVSFSGIDGAGKSTQISALRSWLADVGLRAKILTFWDDVVVLSRFREFMSHKAFKGDVGVGSPEQPLQRRDKNVTSWPMTVVRFGLYAADALSLCWVIWRIKKRDTDVVIFDRYLYDELANLPLSRRLVGAFVRLLVKLAPRPEIAYVIDADPVAALARKPEYPLEFLHSNREAYLALSRLTGVFTVIEPSPVATAQTMVKEAFLEKLGQRDPGFAGSPVLQ